MTSPSRGDVAIGVLDPELGSSASVSLINRNQVGDAQCRKCFAVVSVVFDGLLVDFKNGQRLLVVDKCWKRILVEEQTEIGLALTELLLHLFDLGDIQEEAVPVLGTAGIVIDDHAFIVDPDNLAVSGEQTVIGAERLERAICFRNSRFQTGAILRVHERNPRVRRNNLIRTVSGQFRDLGADIGKGRRNEVVADFFEVGNQGNLLDECLIPDARFLERRLSFPHAGDVVVLAEPRVFIRVLRFDPAGSLQDPNNLSIVADNPVLLIKWFAGFVRGQINRQNALPVFRMDQTDPAVLTCDPLGWINAKHRLDLWADVFEP